MQNVMAYMNQHRQALVDELIAMVALESPSKDKPAVDRLGAHLAGLFEGVGATVEQLPRADRGDILRIVSGGGREEGQTLVLCHMDTVFDIGDIARNPLREEGDRLFGPGTTDMKGGIVLFLWALRCLRDLGLSPRRRVVGLITTDEEVGSQVSRAAIEEEARRSAVALVPESAMAPNGALKTWRKGTSDYKLYITGKPAHAGVDPTRGISAVEELAHQVLFLQRLTDMSIGTTVNVGVVTGGTRGNIVPAEAYAMVDVRFKTLAEGERIDAIIHGVKPVLPGIGLRVEGGINRPPLERTPGTAALFERAREMAAEMGFAITEAGTGGGSDGNFTSAVGCPTLDGLGVCGDGLHTHEEYVEMTSLPQRAALLTRLLQEA